jgi:glyoxylase-like metal-dependent hydrolase (beta-lactamase superfamily II)
MPEWRYMHTPGHTSGHISLFRNEDGVLLAGDAFVTTNQESLIAVMTQKKELHGPPKYFTYNWAC